MPRTGVVNGFYFDKEVFTDYMQEQSTLKNALLVSGVLQFDPKLERMVGAENNVGTIPMFSNIDNEGDALNDDGKTNNTPSTLSGKKQTFMAIARMKAWKENTYTRYLTGKSPLQNLANNLVAPYWQNQWEKDLLAIVKGVMGVSGMVNHKTVLALTSAGTVTDANRIDLTSHIDLAQKALGDNRGAFSLFVCHSVVATRLKKLELITNQVYIHPVTGEDVMLPTLNGMIVFETDTGTAESNSTTGEMDYHSFMLGKGAFLTCDKAVYNPYDVAHDPETDGGVDKLYTKQAKVMHPNGFSIDAENVAEESPTRVELATSSLWTLNISNKLVPIAEIVSNG